MVSQNVESQGFDSHRDDHDQEFNATVLERDLRLYRYISEYPISQRDDIYSKSIYYS